MSRFSVRNIAKVLAQFQSLELRKKELCDQLEINDSLTQKLIKSLDRSSLCIIDFYAIILREWIKQSRTGKTLTNILDALRSIYELKAAGT
jgi:hypothetical protein